MEVKIKPRDYVFSALETGKIPECPWDRNIRSIDNYEYYKKYNLLSIKENKNLWKYVELAITTMVAEAKEKIKSMSRPKNPTFYILYGQYEISIKDYSNYIRENEISPAEKDSFFIIDTGTDAINFMKVYNKIIEFELVPEYHFIKQIKNFAADERLVTNNFIKFLKSEMVRRGIKNVGDMTTKECLEIMTLFESDVNYEKQIKVMEHSFRDILSRFSHLYQSIIWELCVEAGISVIYHYSGRYIQTFACVFRFMKERAPSWPIKMFYTLVPEGNIYKKMVLDLYNAADSAYYIRRGVGAKKLRYYGEAQKTMLIIMQLYKTIEFNILIEQNNILNKNILARLKISIYDPKTGKTGAVLETIEKAKLIAGEEFYDLIDSIKNSVECFNTNLENISVPKDELINIEEEMRQKYLSLIQNPTIHRRPIVHIIVGIAGSGKSTYVKNILNKGGTFYIDLDDVLLNLPFYKRNYKECMEIFNEAFHDVKYILDDNAPIASKILRDEIDIKKYCRLFKCRYMRWLCLEQIFKIEKVVREEIKNLPSSKKNFDLIYIAPVHIIKSIKELAGIYGSEYDYNLNFILADSTTLIKNNIKRGPEEGRFLQYNTLVSSAAGIKNIFEELARDDNRNLFKNIEFFKNEFNASLNKIDIVDAAKIIEENQKIIGIKIGGKLPLSISTLHSLFFFTIFIIILFIFVIIIPVFRPPIVLNHESMYGSIN